MESKQQASRVCGGLLDVLKHARVVWYRGIDGTTAYYEQPAPGVPGMVVVNGQLLITLAVDYEGLYADVPSPQVQQRLVKQGIHLEHGWTCLVERHGLEINEAVRQSRYHAVRHQNGRVSVQCINEREAVIFVDGTARWTMPIPKAPRAFAEMEISTQQGWYPVQHDLLRDTRQ